MSYSRLTGRTFHWCAVLATGLLGAVTSAMADDGKPKSSQGVAKADAPEVRQEHPGFFDQWLKMKGNDQGVIPTGLHAKWSIADQKVLAMAAARPIPNPFVSVDYLGPMAVGGRTRAVLIDRNNNNRIFAGAVSGGLWRSEDRGNTWTAVDDGAASLAVSCMIQNPFDCKVIYYGTGEARANTAGVPGNGLFKSVDGGRTFVHLSSTRTDARFDRCWCLAHSRNAPSTVYAGTESGGLLRSADGGSSWSAVLAGMPVSDVLCFSSGEVLAAASGVGIFHSNSGLAGTFGLVSSAAFPKEFQRIEIAECASQPNVVYSAFESTAPRGGANQFCVSHDGGRTWLQRTTPETNASYRRYCFTLGVHPCDPNLVFCGARFPLFSRDGGSTWQRCENSHSDYHTLATFQDNTNEFIVGNDGGVYQYRWSNPRAPARDLNHGYHVTQFYAGNFAPSGDLIIGGTQDNGAVKLRAGIHRIIAVGDGTHCHISLQDPNLAYIGANNGRLFRSENYLADEPAWSPIDSDIVMSAQGYEFLNPSQINRADGRQLYCRTNQAIWRTLDRGDHWTQLTAGVCPQLYAIACSKHADPVVYFGGDDAKLFRVDRAASAAPGSEQDLSSTVPTEVTFDFIGSIAVHPSRQGTILVSFMNTVARPRLWKVVDADTPGPIWGNVSGDLPETLPVNYVQVDPLDPDQSFFAATDFGLYFSRDGGSHWVKEQRIPNVSIHEIKLRPSDRVLFAFTHGRGVWMLALK